MKELIIEEKAKRYDEAIEIARKIKDSGYEWDADNKKLKLHSNV